MAPLLALRSVSKAFGSLRVIDDLSVSVEPGEALGVIGPNGAGKTTALNLLIGRLRPERGAVVFAERDVTTTPPHARCRAGIALTHQIPHPFEALTVFENVLVGGIFGGGRTEPSAHAAALAALALTGLADRANTRAGTLTLLERKRLELARALATAPRVLLLDEIAGGLGEPEVLELVEVIRRVHREGVAIVWIEHIVHALRSVVGRLAVIAAGRLLTDGPPDEVMRSPEVQRVYLGIDVP
ncbi:MAG TPA: ATP-binding cassette domain-containing protein [Methylomirabilota bacterium]|nr:ATP-binding cassette domain-containing protein [Methylomirabilota bacterium]